MSKIIKTLLITAYVILFIQYLKISLTANTEDIELDYEALSPSNRHARNRRFKSYQNNITAIRLNFKRPPRFASDLKFILKYTHSFLHYSTSLYKNGQDAFIQNKCDYINCFITNNRALLTDLRHFDAVLFDVENGWDGSLLLREPYQNFIFMASESAANYPLCDPFYNNYYNLTWTYRLDSEIRWTYLTISDKKGNIVGPMVNMTWVDPMDPTPAKVKDKLRGKKIAAAWFVSNCKTKSGRGNITMLLEKELKRYDLFIDIYGWCGRKSCPKDRFDECLALLRTDYYFYLSFENSFAEDYVTEKLLHALHNYAVPIVFGGANYSRFLPPGSYIDAVKLNESEIAYEMNRAIKDSEVYENYFRWHNHYEYIKTDKVPEVCKLCKILNEQTDRRSSYKAFLHWWNPNYVHICSHGEGRILVADSKDPIELAPRHLNKELIDLLQ